MLKYLTIVLILNTAYAVDMNTKVRNHLWNYGVNEKFTRLPSIPTVKLKNEKKMPIELSSALNKINDRIFQK